MKKNFLKKSLVTIAAVILVLLLGFADYLSGFEFSFSIFYVMPIVLVCWYSGFRNGLAISILSAIVWFFADRLSGHVYSHNIIPYWNTIARLGFFLIISHAVSRNKRDLLREKYSARIDNITGIANGRHFFESVEVEINKIERYNRPLTVAYIDVDNFKKVNDTQGHNAGDSLLRLIADTIKQNIRAADLVARLGGDEFSILFSETDSDQARTAVNKLQQSILTAVGAKSFPVTFSVGVVTYNSAPRNVNEVIKTADDLMYSVKNTGKNNIKYKLF